MLARRVQYFAESVIRETTRIAQRFGAVNLGQGMPDFDPPEEVKEAACRAVRDGFNQYAVTWGIAPLRQAEGALVLDTGRLSVRECVESIVARLGDERA